MGTPNGHLVVRARRPWRRALFTVMIGLAIAGAGWLAFDYGRQRAGYDAAAARERIDALQAQVAELKQTNRDLREKTLRLERESQVDRQAYREVKENLNALQKELVSLREELAFYRSIVAPGAGEQGLHIRRFGVEPTGVDRWYRFTLVLVQVTKRYETTRGQVELNLAGERNGEKTKLGLAVLAGDEDARIEYAFKYFQTLEGRLELPDGFEPRTVNIRVMPQGDEAKALEQTYSWAELTT